MQLITIDQDCFPAVAAIYAQGLATGKATFETEVPTWAHWDRSHLDFGRIGAAQSDQLLGWAALSPVSSRSVYAGVAEVSVYVSAAARKRGVGQFLLQHLIRISEAHQIWTLQSSVFPDNQASIALHQKCGFRIIGFREKIGQRKGVWHDNVLLERRSTIVGI